MFGWISRRQVLVLVGDEGIVALTGRRLSRQVRTLGGILESPPSRVHASTQACPMMKCRRWECLEQPSAAAEAPPKGEETTDGEDAVLEKRADSSADLDDDGRGRSESQDRARHCGACDAPDLQSSRRARRSTIRSRSRRVSIVPEHFKDPWQQLLADRAGHRGASGKGFRRPICKQAGSVKGASSVSPTKGGSTSLGVPSSTMRTNPCRFRL